MRGVGPEEQMTLKARIPVKEIAVILAILVGIAVFVFGPTTWLRWKAARLLGKSEVTVAESLGQPRVLLTAAEVASLTPEKHPWDYADKPLPYPVRKNVTDLFSRKFSFSAWISKASSGR
jgi:hypothetical protein